MPNPNAEKLRQALWDAHAEFSRQYEYPAVTDDNSVEFMAEFLAARGVLVVSDAVLTDEAIEGMITEVAGDHWAEAPKYENGRAALSRLAKGDPT